MALDTPARPLITARLGGDFSGELSIDGVSEPVTAESAENLREQILTRVSALAGELGRPVQVITEDEEGQWLLVVHPDGEIGEEERLVPEALRIDSVNLVVHSHRAGDAAPEPELADAPEPHEDQEDHDDAEPRDEGEALPDGETDAQDAPDSESETNGEPRDEYLEDQDDESGFEFQPRTAGSILSEFEPHTAFTAEPEYGYSEEPEYGHSESAPEHENETTPAAESDGIRREPEDEDDDLLLERENLERLNRVSTSPLSALPFDAVLGAGSVIGAETATTPLSSLHVELPTDNVSDPEAPTDTEPEFVPKPEFVPEPEFVTEPETDPGTAAESELSIEPVSPLITEAEPEPVPSPGRTSFLAEQNKPDRAKQGWRGFFAKVGLPIRASAKELIERSEIHAVSQHWAGPRTIAIVNGKGGANKTPTTALLAALFARNGGAGVLAWDNNETRGTLGWRTEQGLHDATVQTLLPNVDHLLSPAAQSSDLSHFVHHQTADKYDVLRSNPKMLAHQQRITTDDFDKLHSVAAKYFRLIFIDSGNDESADRWLRMIDHTDQLVIATTALGEHAEAGALLLEALAQRDERSARLAAQAVVIVSQSEKAGTLTDARNVAAGFETLSRRAVSVPFDRAMHGGRLEYNALAPATRRAWLHAAAAVAEGL